MDNVELIHELEIWNEPDGAILFNARLKDPVPTFSVGQEFEFNGQQRYVWGFFPRVAYSDDRTKLYFRTLLRVGETPPPT
jgi:hypothetical protein